MREALESGAPGDERLQPVAEQGTLLEGEPRAEDKLSGGENRGEDRLEPPKKRPRLERDASLDAPSQLSDMTGLSLQRLKHLLLSPAASNDPTVRHELMLHVNAAIQQAQQEGVRSQEAQAILANLVSIASVKSNESVQNLADLPRFQSLDRRGGPQLQAIGSSLRGEPSLPRSIQSLPHRKELAPEPSRLAAPRNWLTPGSESYTRPLTYESSRPLLTERFSIPLPAGMSSVRNSPPSSRQDPPSGRSERFRVYSNAFQQEAGQATKTAKPALSGSRETLTRSKSKGETGRASTTMRAWGKDTWVQKPNKVSVITRSQLNKSSLPKATSAGPTVCRSTDILPLHASRPEGRHASAPDLPPASSSSMGRIVTPPAYHPPGGKMQAEPHAPELPAWLEEQARLGKVRSVTENSTLPERMSPDVDAQPWRSQRKSTVEDQKRAVMTSKSQALYTSAARSRQTTESHAPSNRAFGPAPSQPEYLEPFASPAMMADQLALQWLHQRMTAAQMGQQAQLGNLAREVNANLPFNLLTRPMAGSAMPGASFSQGSEARDWREHLGFSSGWQSREEQEQRYRPLPGGGANALPSIMAMSSMQAARQKTAREAQAAPEFKENSAQPRRKELRSEFQALPSHHADAGRETLTGERQEQIARSKGGDHADQANERRFHELHQQLTSHPGLGGVLDRPGLPHADLPAFKSAGPLRRHETDSLLPSGPRPQRPIPLVGRPPALRAIETSMQEERTGLKHPLGEEDELDPNNPFALQRERNKAGLQPRSIKDQTALSLSEKGVNSDTTPSSPSGNSKKHASDEEEQAAEILLSLVATPQARLKEPAFDPLGALQPGGIRRPRSQRIRRRNTSDKYGPSGRTA